MISHSRTILRPSTPDNNNTVLLHVVPLPRNITRHYPARAQPHPTRLPLARIRLLGPRDADFEADTFHGGAVYEGWRGLFAQGLRLAAAAEDLVECCMRGWCGGKCAGARGSEDVGEEWLWRRCAEERGGVGEGRGGRP